MTLIRLCAAQKEVARDGGRKGMKDWSGGEYSCSFFEADTMSLHPLHTVIDHCDIKCTNPAMYFFHPYKFGDNVKKTADTMNWY